MEKRLENVRQCEGVFKMQPHHARTTRQNRCFASAKTMVGDSWLCLRCARNMRAKDTKRRMLLLILESKWPRVVSGSLIDSARVIEVADLLLPYLGKLPGGRV